MSNDYLWDKSGRPDDETKELEDLLAPLAHDAPLDELRRARGARRDHATAQEPIARRRTKMIIFDKRIIGAAAFTAAALGLLVIALYKRDRPAIHHHTDHRPPVGLGRPLAKTPRVAPVAPTTGADLAITAGESAWIHVPFGAVDVEIQSPCDAEVELSIVTRVLMLRGQIGDPTALQTESNGTIVVGTPSSDGKATTYHLTPGLDPSNGMYEYTSRCVGHPPAAGKIVVDNVNASEPIGPYTNARVFNNSITKDSIHLLGTVMPGARVSIGAKQIELRPADPAGIDPPIYPTFIVDVPVSPERRVTAVRVDDVNGAHFYVIRASSMTVMQSCAKKMAVPQQDALKRASHGDHAGALHILVTAMTDCKPDRDMLSLAVEYACKARNAEAARKYWRLLPAEQQRAVDSACQRNGITFDAP